MKPSEILEAAALLIRKQPRLAKNAYGRDGEGLCAAGAIWQIAYREEACLRARDFCRNICRNLAPPDIPNIGGNEIAAFNDAPETTHGAVCNLLWFAARRAREAGE